MAPTPEHSNPAPCNSQALHLNSPLRRRSDHPCFASHSSSALGAVLSLQLRAGRRRQDLPQRGTSCWRCHYGYIKKGPDAHTCFMLNRKGRGAFCLELGGADTTVGETKLTQEAADEAA